MQLRFFYRICVVVQAYKTVLEAVSQEDLELPILEVRDVKKVTLVVVTGDRGLCGSFNSQVIKAATRRINKLTEQGIQVRDKSWSSRTTSSDNLHDIDSTYLGRAERRPMVQQAGCAHCR